MKKLLMVFPLVFLLCITFSCQQGEEVAEEPAVDIEAEKQVILQLDQQWIEAENRKDLEATMSNAAEGIICQPPDMPQIEGLAALRNFYTELFKILVSIEAGTTNVIVSKSGDMAWQYGWNRNVLEGPEGPIEGEWKYLGVWQKIDGKWKAVAVSFSGNKPLQ
jgi:ketosteroid isomerase-like protein